MKIQLTESQKRALRRAVKNLPEFATTSYGEDYWARRYTLEPQEVLDLVQEAVQALHRQANRLENMAERTSLDYKGDRETERILEAAGQARDRALEMSLLWSDESTS